MSGKDSFIDSVLKGEFSEAKFDTEKEAKKMLEIIDDKLYRTKKERNMFVVQQYPNLTSGEIGMIFNTMVIEERKLLIKSQKQKEKENQKQKSNKKNILESDKRELRNEFELNKDLIICKNCKCESKEILESVCIDCRLEERQLQREESEEELKKKPRRKKIIKRLDSF